MKDSPSFVRVAQGYAGYEATPWSHSQRGAAQSSSSAPLFVDENVFWAPRVRDEFAGTTYLMPTKPAVSPEVAHRAAMIEQAIVWGLVAAIVLVVLTIYSTSNAIGAPPPRGCYAAMKGTVE